MIGLIYTFAIVAAIVWALPDHQTPIKHPHWNL